MPVTGKRAGAAIGAPGPDRARAGAYSSGTNRSATPLLQKR
jgi:hypothetical protein